MGLRRVAPLMVWVGLAAAIGYVLAFDPTDATPDPAGACHWHALFGVDGPGCGGTRMMWHLLHGEVVQAARFHLAALVVVPYAAYALVAWTARSTFGVQMPTWHLSTRVVMTYVVLFLLYTTVLRNLPWEPFTGLRTDAAK